MTPVSSTRYRGILSPVWLCVLLSTVSGCASHKPLAPTDVPAVLKVPDGQVLSAALHGTGVGELLRTVPNRESSELRWVAEDQVGELPLHPGFAASWQRLRTALEVLPLSDDDQLRGSLPRTIEIDEGVFVWCTAGRPDQEPSRLSSRISSLLQVPN